MATNEISFGGMVSRNYEDYLGAFFFEPYAVDLAARIDLKDRSNVLEIACGSGRLTGQIADRLPATASFTATDLNEDMIRVARTKASADRIKWMPADMMHLPFEDASFDLVVCQFGIMLVPDPAKALQEIYRVLQPGGKLVFSTWTDLPYNRVWAIGEEVLQTYLGKSVISAHPGPFAMSSPEAVQEMLLNTGWLDVKTTTVALMGETDSAKQAAYGFIYGLPIAASVQSQRPELLPGIVATLEQRLRAALGEHPLKTPQKALVAEGTK